MCDEQTYCHICVSSIVVEQSSIYKINAIKKTPAIKKKNRLNLYVRDKPIWTYSKHTNDDSFIKKVHIQNIVQYTNKTTLAHYYSYHILMKFHNR